MVRVLCDENVDHDFLSDVLASVPQLELWRVQDVGLRSASDTRILEFAAQNDCVVLTHDVNTMPKYAYERVREGLTMPGLVAVHARAPILPVIADLFVVFGAGTPDDWRDHVIFVPMQ